MAELTQFAKAKRCLAWIEGKGIETIEFTAIEFRPWGVSLAVKRDGLTEDQYRSIKRIFGPMTSQDEWEARGQTGEVELDDNLSIKMAVNRVYTCAKMSTEDVNEMTEVDWDSFKSKAKGGLVEILSCEKVNETL